MHATPPGTLFLARNPRLFALLAERPAVAWPERLGADSFRATIATFRPAYLIEERWHRTEEAATLASLAAPMPVVFENEGWRLRIVPTRSDP
jgi:hypothetical protein